MYYNEDSIVTPDTSIITLRAFLADVKDSAGCSKTDDGSGILGNDDSND